MAEGQLRCAGSPLFLKKTYGVGYQLTVEKKGGETNGKLITSNGSQEEITDYEEQPRVEKRTGEDFSDEELDVILEAIPEASVLSDVGTELKLQIPLGAAPKFPSVFEVLEKQIEDKKVISYGVSMTTLG